MINLPPYGDQFRRAGCFLSTLKTTPTPEPSMKVIVSAGGFWLNSREYVEYRGGSSPDFEAPTINSYWGLLYLNSSGNLRIEYGTPGSNPDFPECPSNSFPIAAVFLSRTSNRITDDMLFDIRGVFLSSATSHDGLTGTDLPNSHPISAIENLQNTLDSMPTEDDLRNALLDKADKDGTPSTTFVLNKDQMGTPTSNVTFVVNRGSEPDATFGWNESLNCWEYSTGTGVVQLTSVGPSIVFPPATHTTLGGIIVGDRLTIDSDGKLHAVQQSEENFSSGEKAKLASVEEGANNYIHPSKHLASEITQEFNLRFMSDNERLKLNSVEENANYYVHPATHPPSIIAEDNTHRFMTDSERSKLQGIEDNANNYEHPNTHPADMIVEDQNHRFITDSERIKLAGIEDNANNYIHPTFHQANMISTDSLHRFVTDDQISGWNDKADLIDIDNRIDQLIGTAPSALDTLGELADALNDNENFASSISAQLANKVDKEAGKGLSDENFTSQFKTKLEGIEDNANNYVHPDTHPASMIVEETDRRFVTDQERIKISNVPLDLQTQLDNKVDEIPGKGLSTNDFDNVYKSKLDGIEDNANHYVHPTSHNATDILEDSTHRFVTDSDKNIWNDKDKYNYDDASIWSVSPPATVSDAINRLAQVVYSLNGNNPI
jgi:hypothetical protein